MSRHEYVTTLNEIFEYQILIKYLEFDRKSGYIGRKNFKREPMENQDREIAPISFSLFYQWRVRERTRYAPKAYIK